MAKQKKKKLLLNFKFGSKRSVLTISLVIIAVFVASGFLFGGKAQGFVSGKLIAKGNFYFNGGAYDLEKAAKWYKAAAFVDGKSSYPHYQLARIYFLKTDYKNGLSEIDAALQINPENKRAYYIRGLIDGYAKNYPAAISDFQKFVAWSPKEWAGYNDLAWAYYENGDYENAKATAERGLAAAPENPWLLNGLGVSLSGLGKFGEARKIFEKTSKLAEGLTLGEWKKAYPGNDPASAEWDLAKFRADVRSNGSLAMSDVSLGGVFAAACASTCEGGRPWIPPGSADMCWDDPICDIHNTLGLYDPVECAKRKSCLTPGSTAECCIDTWPDWPSCTATNCGKKYNPGGSLINGFCEAGAANECCLEQTSQCNNKRYKTVPRCACGSANGGTFCGPPASGLCLAGNPSQVTGTPATWNWTCDGGGGEGSGSVNCSAIRFCAVGNNPPTVSIDNPPDGATNQPQTIAFKATASDQDGDPLTYKSIIICNGVKKDEKLDVPVPTGGVISFPYGPLPYSASCSWEVIVNDGVAPGSDKHTFTIKACSPTDGVCGPANGTNFCNNTWPSDSELCSTGSVSNKVSGGKYGDWTWTCLGEICGGSPVSCSAKGQGSCGWIEVAP